MNILAIETSCDETAAALVNIEKGDAKLKVKILSSVVSSQIKIHSKYGGVVPFLAQMEHRKNIIAVLKETLDVRERKGIKANSAKKLEDLMRHEPEVLKGLLSLDSAKTKKIDAIAVTKGPGLEPALWVGVNTARVLAIIWKKPLIAANHLEGHAFAPCLKNTDIEFPALALIASGGHTELAVIKNFGNYKIIGETRDDAAGEALDKGAKIMGLRYPGGPIIEKLAKLGQKDYFDFPRPMINSSDLDFSFSGLKTSLLYLLRGKNYAKDHLNDLAASYQQAIIDILISKTRKAAGIYRPKTIIVGGGVSLNKELRSQFKKMVKKEFPEVKLALSPLKYSGDNAAMIAVSGFIKASEKKFSNPWRLKADGSMDLS